jgi:hypothetical protein
VIPEELWPDAEAEQAKRMQDDPWGLIVGGRPTSMVSLMGRRPTG